MTPRSVLSVRPSWASLGLLVGATLGLASAACNPLAFFDLRDQAPTVALEAPNDYEGGTFGRVLAPIAALARSKTSEGSRRRAR